MIRLRSLAAFAKRGPAGTIAGARLMRCRTASRCPDRLQVLPLPVASYSKGRCFGRTYRATGVDRRWSMHKLSRHCREPVVLIFGPTMKIRRPPHRGVDALSWRGLPTAGSRSTSSHTPARRPRTVNARPWPMAAKNKCLAQSNKSHTGVPATNSSQIPQQG
jgi:hypothetical protein